MAGQVITMAEMSGCEILDVFSMELSFEDVYAFFEAMEYHPDKAEATTFLGGPALVIGFGRQSGGFKDLKRRIEQRFSCRVFEDPRAILHWFGNGKMSQEPET